MSKQWVFALTAFSLISGSVHAQSANRLKANVPFDFFVGNTAFTAGTYTIRPAGIGGDAIVLRSTDSKEAVVVPAWTYAQGRADHDSKLVFLVSGNRYSLWQIYTEGYSEGLEFYIVYTPTQEDSVHQLDVVVIKATLFEP
jgi:hypothetical protein